MQWPVVGRRFWLNWLRNAESDNIKTIMLHDLLSGLSWLRTKNGIIRPCSHRHLTLDMTRPIYGCRRNLLTASDNFATEKCQQHCIVCPLDGSRRRERPRKSWKDNANDLTGQSMSSLLHIADVRTVNRQASQVIMVRPIYVPPWHAAQTSGNSIR